MAPPGKQTSSTSPDGASGISAKKKAGAPDRCLAGPDGEPRLRPAIQAAKVGYLTQQCMAKAGALRLLDSKASAWTRTLPSRSPNSTS